MIFIQDSVLGKLLLIVMGLSIVLTVNMTPGPAQGQPIEFWPNMEIMKYKQNSMYQHSEILVRRSPGIKYLHNPFCSYEAGAVS